MAPDATGIPASPPHRIEHGRGYHRCCYHRVPLCPRQIPLHLRRRGRAGERRPRLRLRRLPPPLRRTASSTAEATTVSPYALTRSPSVSAAEAEQESVVRVYGSDGCPVAWRLSVSLLYKAAAPVHFTPSEAAPLGRPVLRFSTSDPEVSGAADELLRHVDARFEGKPRVAPSKRPAARASLAAAAAEEVAELVRLQHRSAERRLEGVAAKVAEMVKKAGKGRGVVEGAEVRRVGKWYGDAMEVMLEHARMEEKVLFPDIQRFS